MIASIFFIGFQWVKVAHRPLAGPLPRRRASSIAGANREMILKTLYLYWEK
jgi:hypothetical protein